jgi:hypothetical protein
MNAHKAPIPKVAARLYVLLAGQANRAVVLRRGPAKQVCSIGWNLDTDTFQLGQWLKGRIYEAWSDISPDGKHWFYHASQHHKIRGEEYSVVARTPYLKALKFWRTGYVSGGFLPSNELMIPQGNSEGQLFEVSPWRKSRDYIPKMPFRGSSELAAWILKRDGWIPDGQPAIAPGKYWSKRAQGWELSFTMDRKSLPTERTYAVRQGEEKSDFNCTGWQWAEIREDRLLWAEAGKIFATHLAAGSHSPVKELADFNDWKFEPVVAPY